MAKTEPKGSVRSPNSCFFDRLRSSKRLCHRCLDEGKCIRAALHGRPRQWSRSDAELSSVFERPFTADHGKPGQNQDFQMSVFERPFTADHGVFIL